MATKGGSGGGEKSVDDLTFVGIIVLGLAVGAFLVWMAARDKITMFYVYARRVQLVLVDALGALGVPGAASVHEWFQKACAASDLFSRCSRDFKTISQISHRRSCASLKSKVSLRRSARSPAIASFLRSTSNGFG